MFKCFGVKKKSNIQSLTPTSGPKYWPTLETETSELCKYLGKGLGSDWKVLEWKPQECRVSGPSMMLYAKENTCLVISD